MHFCCKSVKFITYYRAKFTSSRVRGLNRAIFKIQFRKHPPVRAGGAVSTVVFVSRAAGWPKATLIESCTEAADKLRESHTSVTVVYTVDARLLSIRGAFARKSVKASERASERTGAHHAHARTPS